MAMKAKAVKQGSSAAAVKKQAATKKKRKVQRVMRTTLRSALLSKLKEQSGRKDLTFDEAPQAALQVEHSVRIEDRAGFPLKLAKGAVHPKDWVTKEGVKIEVDFARAAWMPDDWGQGIKPTSATSRSTNGGGGILTSYVSPDGKTVYYHKSKVEEYVGRSLGPEDGHNGQVRLAKQQAHQQIQLQRALFKNKGASSQSLIGTDPDESLFKLLSPQERKHLAPLSDFHFCVVSARRASKPESIRDLFVVQMQMEAAGVTPTWYVDKESIKDYQKLGLKVVVGGKLTPSRNQALKDANRAGKICVQVSDDISAWEYREGKRAAVRTDDAQNAAHAAARRYIISPAAAARFILAKMRGAAVPQPKLGGVYMLGSCARTFCGDPFARHHFILGDFFVVDKGSKVLFDEEMTLKEDYDFSCAHIKAHGSVMRCQRMTLNVKHYDNSGGAVDNRDKKGEAERRNVEVLNRKWPGCFRANPKRKGEVIMKWKESNEDPDDDEEAGSQAAKLPRSRASAAKQKKTAVSTAKKTTVKKVALKRTVAKVAAKRAAPSDFPLKAVLKRTGKDTNAQYISDRLKKVAGLTVEKALGSHQLDGSGNSKPYSKADLRYDLDRGYLALPVANAGA
eukprot:gnl/TRDRNA2_/TRDRNA2_181715_c0_seq1.p1 gnl/TRDRNA2_/TRDRNA2_181715_c0~~gnl/TRDRNA2_/TRDRNA2_181715_c0_seq1.p1  ORF type:complete len:621 (+),score=146.30 gnl/TRDRNA2_/TRDRNA2_181715_c0_seq1:68-1930(+)